MSAIDKKKEERIQSEFLDIEKLLELEEKMPVPPESVLNISSWLLTFSPEELAVFAILAAIIVANALTLEENAVIGSFFTALADNIFLIAAQRTLIKTAAEEQKSIENYKKELLKQQKSQTENKQNDLEEIKKRLKALEELLNKQVRN